MLGYEPARVGRISAIEQLGSGLKIDFVFDHEIEPLGQAELASLATPLQLDVQSGELACRHWDVKQADLYSVLTRHREPRWVTSETQPSHNASDHLILNGGYSTPAVRLSFFKSPPDQSRTTSQGSHSMNSPAQSSSAPGSRPRVFIVHGHNREAKFEVKALLSELGLEGIILDEQTGGGRTIIDKFENEAEKAAYAVVLLTPDDQGGVASAGAEQMKPRARQNVILELGYFAAKLGRGHVCALRQGDVEIPSDYKGVEYVDYDAAGAWKTRLAREMRAAGLPVDMNLL